MPYINSPVSEIPQGKSTATPNATPRDINMMKGVMGACVDRLEAETNAQTSPNKVARGKYLLFNGSVCTTALSGLHGYLYRVHCLTLLINLCLENTSHKTYIYQRWNGHQNSARI